MIKTRKVYCVYGYGELWGKKKCDYENCYNPL